MSATISTANLRIWFALFITAKQAAGRSPRTLDWYRDRLGIYLRWIDEHNGLAPLDATALEAFVASQQMIRAPTTCQSTYRVLSTFCSWLIKRHYITANESPIPLVDKPKIPKRRMKYVTKDEFDRIYASIRGDQWVSHRDRLLFTILFYSGLRVSELLALRLQDIELDEKVIHVRSGKGDKGRMVPFAPDVPALLASYLDKRPPGADTGVLWVSNNGAGGIRGPMAYDGLKEMLRRRSKLAGMPKLRPHAFRHGFAMWALNSGVPMSAVSSMMGHTSVVVTESVYAHWVTSAIKREYSMAFDRLASGEVAAP